MTKNTSWENSQDWYNECVGEKGHYYHQSVILENVIKILDLKAGDHLLDVGCGQGVLQRKLPPTISYTGIDSSKSLIDHAKKGGKGNFFVADACKPLPLNTLKFQAACFILSMQNMEKQDLAIKYAAERLEKGGKMVLVLNHPCFRIPRQSHWGIDEKAKIQYRRLNLYMSDQKIPIQTHPSQNKDSPTTFSFHHPLSSYVKWLSNNNLVITGMDEWCSDKTSTGAKSKMENRARQEFPLFLALTAQKY